MVDRSSAPPASDAGQPVDAPVVLRAGAVIDGKYQLVRCLDAGGMGSVWEVHHASLDQAFALKFLSHRRAGSPEARSRFDLEARLAARLGQASPHIVRVIDSGVVTEADGASVPYLAMELLRGRTLGALLEERGRLPLSRAAALVAQLCLALEVTHREGVVHRDLKPSNLFLCRDEQTGQDEAFIKLIDFGIAKTQQEQEHATTLGTVLGSAGYMSPEQISGTGEIGPATDLWAVVAVTYRTVVGKSPFGGGPPEEIAMRILSAVPAPPSRERTGLPVAFDRWVARGLAKHPDDRFASAAELRDSLELAAAEDERDAPSASAVADSVPPSGLGDPDRTTARHSVAPEPRATPRRWALVLGAVAVLLGAGALAWALREPTQRPDSDRVAPIPTPSSRSAAASASPPPSASAPRSAPAPSSSVEPPSPAAASAPATRRDPPRGAKPPARDPKRARDSWLDTSTF